MIHEFTNFITTSVYLRFVTFIIFLTEAKALFSKVRTDLHFYEFSFQISTWPREGRSDEMPREKSILIRLEKVLKE